MNNRLLTLVDEYLQSISLIMAELRKNLVRELEEIRPLTLHDYSPNLTDTSKE